MHRYVFEGLTSRALPLVIISALAGLGALAAAPWPTPPRGPAGRVAAAGALVLGWGVAQWDYLLPETLTVSAAAAPSGTITAVLVAAGLAVLLIVPAFILLYVLDQRGLLPEEGATTSLTSEPGSRVPESSILLADRWHGKRAVDLGTTEEVDDGDG